MLLLAGSVLAAACPTWDAAFRAERLRGSGSSALRYSWAPPPSCSGFPVDHLEICWTQDTAGSMPVAPARPGDCLDADSTQRHAVEYVHRSNRSFALQIFACGDEACSPWYPSTSRTIAGVTTDKERWVIGEVDGYTDPDRTISDPNATAASAFVYPADFSSVGRLGIWYSTGDGGGQKIRQRRSRSTRWGHWNTNGARFGPVVDVAYSAMGAGAFGWVTHPWAVPAMDAGMPYVRLFVQADDDNNTKVDEPYQVWSVDSLDEDGTDYGLVCLGGACAVDLGACAYGQPCDWLDASLDGGVAMPELGATGDIDSAFLTSASHGQLLFPWLSDTDGAVDFGTETPSLLFTGASDGCAAAPDDLFLGAWDGATWGLEIDGGNCPVVAMEDAHDPSAIPLPDGSFKVYMQLGMTEYQVCHLDGDVVEGCEPIELAFDDGTWMGQLDETLASCTDNFTAFVADMDGSLHQATLLHAMGAGTGCFDTGAGGILMAELRN